MRLAGLVVGLTASDARVLGPILAAGVTELRRNGSSVPAGVLELVDDIRAAGGGGERILARAVVAASAATVPRFAASGTEAALSSRWLTCAEVSTLLGIQERAVRKACQEGRLSARQKAGRSAWEISEASAQAMKTAKQQRRAG
jgi:hypothetical protein